MANPESVRILNDERALQQSEVALASEEQALWKRLDALLAVSFEPRAQALLGRIDNLETQGAASPDLGRARAVVATAAAGEPTPASGERQAALQARKSALQAREAALKALTTALTDLEKLRNRRQKELDAVETFVAGTEAALRQMEEQRKQAEALARIQSEQDEEPVAPPVAKKAAPEPTPTVVVEPIPTVIVEPPPAPVVAKPKPAPAPEPKPAPVEAKSKKKDKDIKPAPTVEVKPAPAPEPKPARAPAAPVAAAPAKKVSRRRKAKIAPPPRKLEVEVAEYGENNFYAGFDNKITTGGLFVASLETLPPGHELELEIDVAGKKIKTRGRVEFSRVDNFSNAECTPGAGVKLLSLSGDQAGAIESFFQKRAPMFYMPVQQ